MKNVKIWLKCWSYFPVFFTYFYLSCVSWNQHHLPHCYCPFFSAPSQHVAGSILPYVQFSGAGHWLQDPAEDVLVLLIPPQEARGSRGGYPEKRESLEEAMEFWTVESLVGLLHYPEFISTSWSLKGAIMGPRDQDPKYINWFFTEQIGKG